MQLTTKPSVLIVDDAPDNLMLIKMLLQGRCQVQQAGNGMQALLLARNPPYPDLILLDVLMPEMDGYAVCAELKANPTTRDIPVIFLTSRNQVQDQQRGFQSGAVDYITKPIDPEVLQARVSTHLHLKELRALLKQQDMQMPDCTQEVIRLQYFLAALARRMQTKSKFADSTITQLFHATALYSAMPHAASATNLPSDAGQQTILRFAQEMHACQFEKFDGSGQPDGLRGERIPFSARLLHVANTYAQLSAGKLEQPALDQSEVLQAIREQSGRSFDPEVVAAAFDISDQLLAIACQYTDSSEPIEKIKESS